jgi:outer membrane protein insertion porin family
VDYDQRDDPFTPTKGYRIELGGSIFPEALGSQVALTEGHTQFTTLHPISNFWTYALNFRGSMLRVNGNTDNVPLGSRYFIGGRDTLRGYTRYQVSARSQSGFAAGGDTALSMNNEFRYQLTNSVLGLVFLDIGQAFLIQDKGFTGDSKANLQSLRYSPGVGAQYLTPIGPLGLEVGFATDREFGERWGRMLVSIGSAF